MDDLKKNKKISQSSATTRSGKSSPKKLVALGLGIILLLTIFGSLYYYKYSQSESYKANKVKKETQAVITAASKLILLPEGEPSVFAIQDPDLLVSQQIFFKGSVKGDQLLVYPQSGKAIIYSPSKNIIINSGPITFDDKKKDSPIDSAQVIR